jgi:hypothetical protein
MRKLIATLAVMLVIGTASAALRSCTKTCNDVYIKCTKYTKLSKCIQNFNYCSSTCSKSFNINRAIMAMIDEEGIN